MFGKGLIILPLKPFFFNELIISFSKFHARRTIISGFVFKPSFKLTIGIEFFGVNFLCFKGLLSIINLISLTEMSQKFINV